LVFLGSEKCDLSLLVFTGPGGKPGSLWWIPIAQSEVNRNSAEGLIFVSNHDEIFSRENLRIYSASSAVIQ